MTTKNPFEIRSDMLQLAKEYMDLQCKMNVEYTSKMFEAGQKTAEELKEAMTPYSMDELMDKAKEMYNFVQSKN